MTSEAQPSAAMRTVRTLPGSLGWPAEGARTGRRDELELLDRREVDEELLAARGVEVDLREGEELLPSGFALTPAALGILASVGLAEVPVRPRVRVAILTTGDELVDASATPGPGQIRDSNVQTMCGQAAAFGAVPLPIPRVPDTREAVTAALARARAMLDVPEALAWVLLAVAALLVVEYGLIRPFQSEVEAWRRAARPWGVKR